MMNTRFTSVRTGMARLGLVLIGSRRGPLVWASALAMSVVAPSVTAQSNPGCYADCDISTGVGTLDIFDFLCFQNSFVNAEPYACDCDVSTGSAVCDIFDFLCFQNEFVAGCTVRGLNPPGTLPSQAECPLPSGGCGTTAVPAPLVDSVHLFSGEFHTGMIDMAVAGRGFDFCWKRTYRSLAGPDTSMGEKWDFSYNIFLESNGTHLDLHSGNARFDTYFLRGNGTWSRPEYFREIRQAGTHYELVHADASRWEFHLLNGSAVAGKLRAIVDRNGNTMTFAYDATGRLITITDTLDQPNDPNLRRQYMIAYHPGTDLIWYLEDYVGRRVEYQYYQTGQIGGTLGQLKSVRSPIVTGSPGSAFPSGKTTMYTYEPAAGGVPGKLSSITDPMGQEYLVNSYDAATGRLVQQQLGDVGDLINISYAAVSPGPLNGNAVVRAVVNDRVGHVAEALFDDRNRCVRVRDYTGRWNPDLPTADPVNPPTPKLRSSDPDVYETAYVYNDDALPTSVLYPNLDEHRFVYDETNASPMGRGNLLVDRRLPGPLGGDQAEIVETFEYLASLGGCCGTSFVTRHTDARGNVTVNEYDPRANRVRTIHRIPSIAEDWTYNQFGQVTTHLLPRNDVGGGGTRRLDQFDYHPMGTYQYGYMQFSTVDQSNLQLRTQIEYNDRGVPRLITDPRGTTEWHEINELDQIVFITRRLIRLPVLHIYATAFFHDANDNVVQINIENRDNTGLLQPNNWFTTTTDYDILNVPVRITQEVNPAKSIVTEYAYDANRNRTLVRNGEATNGNDAFNTVRTLYDERDLVYREIRAPGHPTDQSTTQYDYDPNANLAIVQDGIESQPHTTLRLYDGYDRLTVEIDPMGNETAYHYDANSNLGGEAGPGSPNPFAVRVLGELVDVPGSAGNVRLRETMYTYDALDRSLTETQRFFDTATQAPLQGGHALGSSLTQRTYTDTSQLKAVGDDRANTTTYTYDSANRLATIVDAAGNSQLFTYDANSNLTQVTAQEVSQGGGPLQVFTTTMEYDGVDRPIAQTDNVGNRTTFEYDSRDNLLLMIDPIQHETRYDYDGLNRLTSTHREEFIDLGQTWDDSSRLTNRTDANGNTTSYQYDALDRLRTTVNADCTQHTNLYDAHDNVIRRTDANGTVCDLVHDELDRLTRKDITTFGPMVALDTTFEVFAYDGLSRLVRAEDDDALVLFSHDSMSNVTDETLFIGRPFLTGHTTASTHDGVGNQTSCTYPGGRQISRTYESLNRLRNVSDQQGSIATYSFVGPERVERRDYGNGTWTLYTYDGITGIPNDPNDFGVKQIVRTQHLAAAGVVDDHTYFYDALYNKTQRKDLRAGGPGLTHSYGYDAVYRQVFTFVTDALNNIVRETDYTLDGVGNRQEVFGQPNSGLYTMDNTLCVPGDFQMNQYTTTPIDTRLYDDNNNLVTIDAGLTSEEQFRYDYRNRLTSYNNPSQFSSAQYRYDALGRRIERVAVVNSVPVKVQYFYDSWSVIEEDDGQELSVATYVYGWPCPDGPCSMRRNGTDHYFHESATGHVMAVTANNAVPVERYDYGDFGAPEFYTGEGIRLELSAIENPLLFAARRYDPETGLFYNRYRYLDPMTGRFISADPIGAWADPSSLGGAFAYAGNNPASFGDPYGLLTLRIGGAIGAFSGKKGGGLSGGIFLDLGWPLWDWDIGLYGTKTEGNCVGFDWSGGIEGGFQGGGQEDLSGSGTSVGGGESFLFKASGGKDTSSSGRTGLSGSIGVGVTANAHSYKTETRTISVGDVIYGAARGVISVYDWATAPSQPNVGKPKYTTAQFDQIIRNRNANSPSTLRKNMAMHRSEMRKCWNRGVDKNRTQWNYHRRKIKEIRANPNYTGR